MENRDARGMVTRDNVLVQATDTGKRDRPCRWNGNARLSSDAKKDHVRRDSASISEAVAIFADSSVCRAPQRAAVWTEPASRQEDATPPRKPGPSGGLRGADALMRPLPTQHRQQNPAGRHDFVGQESHATAEGSKAKNDSTDTSRSKFSSAGAENQSKNPAQRMFGTQGHPHGKQSPKSKKRAQYLYNTPHPPPPSLRPATPAPAPAALLPSPLTARP
jgi:hypothetical protein